MDAIASASPAASRRRWFVLGLLLFFTVVSAVYSVKVAHGGSAIVRWKNQLLDIEEGDNPYRGSPYPNPPIMAVLLVPFAKLPPLAAALSWFYVKVGLTLLSLFWVFRLVESPERPFPEWARALVVLLSLRPILGDLMHGNVNLFIMFLVVAALYAFRRGKDALSGLVIGLAIACKVTPALFVPYFVWKRAWRALGGCAAGLVLFFWLVPGLILGQQHNAECLRSWANEMVKPYLVQGKVYYSEHNNQSLPGLMVRLATHSPSFSTYVNDQYTPLQYHNFVALDPAVVRWLIKGCMAAFAALIIWSCRTPTEPRHGWRLAAEYGLIVLGMLLFSERTWKHHCVTLVVPLAVIGYYLAACRPGRGLAAGLIGCLAAVVLLMSSTSTLRLSARWDELAKLSQVYGAYVFVYLILAAVLIALLRRPVEESQPVPQTE